MPDDPNGARANAIWKELEPALPQILGAFYEGMKRSGTLSQTINDNKHTTNQLQGFQSKHWETVFKSGGLRQLEAEARKIGSAHVRIGLTSDWFIAGYERVLMHAIPAILKTLRFRPQCAAEAVVVLVARMFLDMALANESYSSQMTDKEPIEWREVNDYQNLRTIANAMHGINRVTLNLAVLSDSTNEASSSSESVAAAVEELVSSIQQLSDTSQTAAHAAEDTNSRLVKGWMV